MTASKVVANRGRFRKGRSKTGGRRRGTANKATAEWRELCLGLSQDPAFQDALKKRVLEKPELLLRIAEFAVGKPKESHDIHILEATAMVDRLMEARKRLARRGRTPD